MKTTLLILLSLSIFTLAKSSDREHEKKVLQDLVQEREQRFGEYSRAAGSRSGIFGNKTKKDLQAQVDVLTDIVKTDNRIISTLNTFLSYRTFQQTETTYSQAELDDKNTKLNELTTSLANQLKEAKESKKAIQINLKWAKVWNYLLIGVAVCLGIMWWREKRKVAM